VSAKSVVYISFYYSKFYLTRLLVVLEIISVLESFWLIMYIQGQRFWWNLVYKLMFHIEVIKLNIVCYNSYVQGQG